MRSSTEIALVCLIVASAAGTVAWLLAKQRHRRFGSVGLPLAMLAALGALAALSWACVLLGLPLAYDRTGTTRQVAPGVLYRRLFLTRPRPHPVHVLEVGLDTPGLRLVLTAARPADGRPYAAATTSTFLGQQRASCVAAINASFFFPFHSSSPWDYYPRVGDGVDVLGRYGTRNDRHGQAWHGARMNFAGSRVAFGGAPSKYDGTIEGRRWLVRDGRRVAAPATRPYSRMALGLSDRTLLAVAVDGKIDRLAEGLTLAELTALMLELGADHAIELDGGGSVTLALRRRDGAPEVVNLVSHTRVPFLERPVATHLGICVDGP